MNFQFRNFSVVQAFFCAIVLLIIAAIGAGSGISTGANRQVAQTGSALQAVSITVRISEQIDCESPTDPATRVFFDIMPKEGREFTVIDHGYVRKFDVLASYEEAGLDGYFSNGSYEGLFTAQPGYTLAISAVVPFTVASRCGGAPPMPPLVPELIPISPVKEPTITPPVIQTISEPPLLPKEAEEPAQPPPASGNQAVAPTDSTTISSCGSETECAQLCSAKGGTNPAVSASRYYGAKACEEFTGEVIVPAPLSTLPAEQLNNEFREKTMDVFLDERSGVRAFADSDHDDITDFDEVNIYGTDPKVSDTDRDGVTDGAELLSGTNPSSTAASGVESKIIFEDPAQFGKTASEMLAVATVAASGTTTDTSGEVHISSLTISGKAPANSFITIFVYSEPIVVTIKTDEFGSWTYTLDKELPDGSHEVFAAVADSKGRVWAKSSPLPFVKTAAAVSVGSPILAPQNQAPGFFAGGSLYMLIVILVGILAIALLLIGWVTKQHASATTPDVPPHEQKN